MDIADIAQETEERVREMALRFSPRKIPAPVFSPGEDRGCLCCGCSIPSRRLEAVPGAVRCVRCQAEYERGLF